GGQNDIGAAGEAVGATLAQLSAYTFPQAGFFAPDLSIAEPLLSPADAYAAFVRESLADGRPAARLGQELARQLLALIAEHATLLHAVDPTPRLTHCDYKAQNLLVRQQCGQWETAAVLDWEFAAATSPLFDLGNLLRYSDRLPRAFEQGVIAGYTAGGCILPPEWKRVIRLMDLVNLLTFLDTDDDGNPMIGEVAGLVRATVEHWETF
ncbi:MAG: phosphotransferase family protein, partial [Nitrososphaerota archaeon]